MATDTKVMKPGKAAPAVLDRSVLRPLKLVSERSPAADFSAPLCASTADHVLGSQDLTEEMLILSAVNQLYAKGAGQAGVMLSLVWPAALEESALKACMERAGRCCAGHGIRILGGHTQAGDGLSRPVFSVTAVSLDLDLPGGKSAGLAERPSDGLSDPPAGRVSGTHSGSRYAVVMARESGLAGSMVLAGACEMELRRHFPSFMADHILDWGRYLSVRRPAQIGRQQGAVYMKPVSWGGISAALWELGEDLECGMEIRLRDILLRQETVELTELLNINPYQLFGCGSLLIVCEKPEIMVSALRAEGVPAAAIGYLQEGKARILRNGEDAHYLEKPAADPVHLPWAVRTFSR